MCCFTINILIIELPYGWERKVAEDGQVYFIEYAFIMPYVFLCYVRLHYKNILNHTKSLLIQYT